MELSSIKNIAAYWTVHFENLLHPFSFYRNYFLVILNDFTPFQKNLYLKKHIEITFKDCDISILGICESRDFCHATDLSGGVIYHDNHHLNEKGAILYENTVTDMFVKIKN